MQIVLCKGMPDHARSQNKDLGVVRPGAHTEHVLSCAVFCQIALAQAILGQNVLILINCAQDAAHPAV